MFSKALKAISEFTGPVIVSKRLADGTIRCGCGTFIVVNSEGWILTAAHILEDALLAQQHGQEREAYNKECDAINNNKGLLPDQRRKKIAHLRKNPKWIVNQSYWWGLDGLRVNEFRMDKLADLAAGKLENFQPGMVKQYPLFRNPYTEIEAGTSLCRLGFPFSEIKATFNESTNSFTFADGVLPIPRFPNEAIHTRILMVVDEKTQRQAKFLETSTPGLRGQSGGPIVDVNGYICGLQSRTVHLPLGFAPVVKDGGKEITEHQFMHVGVGAHVQEIMKFLDANNISYSVAG